MLARNRRKLEEVEVEHQEDLLKVVEDTEAELRQKDQHLAVLEARLCQLRIQIDNERRLSPKGLAPVVFPEEVTFFSEKLQCPSLNAVALKISFPSCASIQFVQKATVALLCFRRIY